MIFIYGDDSADEKRERVCAIAVVAGSEAAWREIEEKWIPRNGNIPFHAKDCESDKGDNEHSSHEDNKKLYRDCTTILAESKLGGLGLAIDLVAQKQIFPQALNLAYFTAFSQVLERCAHLAMNYNDSAKLLFDISTQNEYNAGLLYAWARGNDPRLLERLDPEIAFAQARSRPRITGCGFARI
jgi:hypothetical protein